MLGVRRGVGDTIGRSAASARARHRGLVASHVDRRTGTEVSFLSMLSGLLVFFTVRWHPSRGVYQGEGACRPFHGVCDVLHEHAARLSHSAKRAFQFGDVHGTHADQHPVACQSCGRQFVEYGHTTGRIFDGIAVLELVDRARRRFGRRRIRLDVIVCSD
ncbi:hypothetical protein C8R47DRAFT_1883 [Mycena vitilis]|nr:hypothetical protein C8R47DRAFT_1883 [Mycena vitilis]